MFIDLEVLQQEMKLCGITAGRLVIDRNAAVIDPEDKTEEKRQGLRDRIASTLSGTGAATARKVLRQAGLRLAQSVPELREFIGDVSQELNAALDRGDHIIVEGTQGFGLSLHHCQDFPYCTSRDTTAAAFLADAGLSPRLLTDIVLVLRTYPIRVGGHSGPMWKEITWREVAARSGCPHELAEYTTVTGTLRRVGEFDWALAERAVEANRPTALALHGADYLDHSDYGKCWLDDLGSVTRAFVRQLEVRLGTPVRYLFTGHDDAHIVCLEEGARSLISRTRGSILQ
jgi:adenylosuccinate synthase